MQRLLTPFNPSKLTGHKRPQQSAPSHKNTHQQEPEPQGHQKLPIFSLHTLSYPPGFDKYVSAPKNQTGPHYILPTAYLSFSGLYRENYRCLQLLTTLP